MLSSVNIDFFGTNSEKVAIFLESIPKKLYVLAKKSRNDYENFWEKILGQRTKTIKRLS